MDIRALVDRWVEAFGDTDLDSLAELMHPDFVEVYPQSGELIRGFEKFKAIVSSYPGLPEGEVIGTS
jgi:ketosteroid isomerase-like protein